MDVDLREPAPAGIEATMSASSDAWWLSEFARIAAEPDPVRRAVLATRGIRHSEEFRDHCSALRDIAISEALGHTRNKDLAEILGVTESLVSTIGKKGDIEGARAIVRRALQRARRLRVTEP